MEIQRQIPLIVSDMDGVLILSHHEIPGVQQTLKQKVLKSMEEISPQKFQGVKEKLPFMVLTNRGGTIEQIQVEDLNKTMNLNKQQALHSEQIVLNFSPFRQILQSYKDKLILVDGIGDIDLILKDIGINKYITVKQYLDLYPELHRLSIPWKRGSIEQKIQTFQILKSRFDAELQNFHRPIQIHAIFLLHNIQNWEESLQLVLDLLSTPDGKIPMKGDEYIRQTSVQTQRKHIPVHVVQDDLVYSNTFPLPRIVLGAYNVVLQAFYQQLYGEELELIQCGKPQKISYDFCMQFAQQNTSLPIGNTYMIGDNPESDIKGANNAGWVSILVQTGVFAGHTENDLENPATYVVQDFSAAIDLIYKLENFE